MLRLLFFFIWPIYFAVTDSSNEGVSITIEVHDGASWRTSRSKAVAVGSFLRLRCVIDNNKDLDNNATLIRRAYDMGSSLYNKTVVLRTGRDQKLVYEKTNVQLADSGVYECLSGSFSEVATIHVYQLTDLQSVTFPTRTQLFRIANIRLIRRQFDTARFNDSKEFWLSCSCIVGSQKLLDLITVEWRGGLLGAVKNQTEMNPVYTQTTQRNRTYCRITTKLRLNRPVPDSRVFGEYQCIFSFQKSERVSGRVHLNVAPILRLSYEPPPLPPPNFYGRFICTDPPCTARTDDTNLSDPTVANWTSACDLVAAYPPVLPGGIIWAWNQPEWAAFAIRRVKEVGSSNYLTELSTNNGAGGSAAASTDDDTEGRSPMQVLERRRRSLSNNTSMHVETRSSPSQPVIFWCWTENKFGETAVWWPGPSEEPNSNFWTSVWWPILGVGLELVSLAVVFAFFHYCNRKKRQHRYSHAPRNDDGTSFGLSRLLDTSERHPVVPETKRTTHTGPSRLVPYVRLSSQPRTDISPSEPEPSQISSIDLPSHPHSHSTAAGHVNPSLTNDQEETQPTTKSSQAASSVAPDEHETDEYFWDSDGEVGAPVGKK